MRNHPDDRFDKTFDRMFASIMALSIILIVVFGSVAVWAVIQLVQWLTSK